MVPENLGEFELNGIGKAEGGMIVPVFAMSSVLVDRSNRAVVLSFVVVAVALQLGQAQLEANLA